MQPATELADRLVGYDRRLAEKILRLVLRDLGGPTSDGEIDVEAAKSFLNNPPAGPRLARMADIEESPATTEEWKTEFRHENRLRDLGLELCSLLGT